MRVAAEKMPPVGFPTQGLVIKAVFGHAPGIPLFRFRHRGRVVPAYQLSQTSKRNALLI
jgi:hypothetical protein